MMERCKCCFRICERRLHIGIVSVFVYMHVFMCICLYMNVCIGLEEKGQKMRRVGMRREEENTVKSIFHYHQVAGIVRLLTFTVGPYNRVFAL